MSAKHLVNSMIGLLVTLRQPTARDERGLSQSTENAILLAGAVGIASAVILAIGTYVARHMP